jgi:hypothetical protein
MENSIDVDNLFPDPLKEPVLRKVQFSTVSRIDTLGKSGYGVVFCFTYIRRSSFTDETNGRNSQWTIYLRFVFVYLCGY